MGLGRTGRAVEGFFKGTLMGTTNREPQAYSRNFMEYMDPGRYIPIIFLLYSWGSLFGVPIRVPLFLVDWAWLDRNLRLWKAEPGRPFRV